MLSTLTIDKTHTVDCRTPRSFTIDILLFAPISIRMINDGYQTSEFDDQRQHIMRFTVSRPMASLCRHAIPQLFDDGVGVRASNKTKKFFAKGTIGTESFHRHRMHDRSTRRDCGHANAVRCLNGVGPEDDSGIGFPIHEM